MVRTAIILQSSHRRMSFTVCRPVLNSCSNCTCPRSPPLHLHPQTPNARINLVHPGGKNPAAANAVPPSKLCPRSSTNSKVMRMPRPLSSHPFCLPQLQGKERKWGRERQRKRENVRLCHTDIWLRWEVLPFNRTGSTDYWGVMGHAFLEVGGQGRPGAVSWASLHLQWLNISLVPSRLVPDISKYPSCQWPLRSGGGERQPEVTWLLSVWFQIAFTGVWGKKKSSLYPH